MKKYLIHSSKQLQLINQGPEVELVFLGLCYLKGLRKRNKQNHSLILSYATVITDKPSLFIIDSYSIPKVILISNPIYSVARLPWYFSKAIIHIITFAFKLFNDSQIVFGEISQDLEWSGPCPFLHFYLVTLYFCFLCSSQKLAFFQLPSTSGRLYMLFPTAVRTFKPLRICNLSSID